MKVKQIEICLTSVTKVMFKRLFEIQWQEQKNKELNNFYEKERQKRRAEWLEHEHISCESRRWRILPDEQIGCEIVAERYQWNVGIWVVQPKRQGDGSWKVLKRFKGCFN
ncbi:unnamed protein product [Paramecium octaurelia]|uniref:Uncharacterized protein n=1 Tax=Paramecium octaurelia TaxID=43137 RepID=A0A8S1W5X5_PAROT|nr:unnamed protein product [Paramecium octaurelia]